MPRYDFDLNVNWDEYIHPSYCKTKLWTSALPLAVLILLWVVLYLPNLRTTPGWFMDETAALDSAIELVHGRAAYGAVYNTFYHPMGPYQPVYLFVTGLFGQGDILGARLLNTLFGLGIALVIFIWGRRFLGTAGSFSSALLFLVYDQSVIHFRSVFPHNMAALGFVIAALFLSRKARCRNDLIIGLSLVLAAMAHPIFIYAALGVLVVRFQRPKMWPFLFGPLALYLFLNLGVLTWLFKGWLWQDIGALFQLYKGHSAYSGRNLFYNLFNFYSYDWFHIGAYVGLILCFPRKYYKLGVFTIIVSLLLLQNRNNLTVFYYQAVVLLPALCLCWGVLVVRANQAIRKIFSFSYNVAQFAVFLIVGFCVGHAIVPILENDLQPRSFYAHVKSVPELEAVAGWINEHTTPEDLVVTNTNIGWMLNARIARRMQTMMWDGVATGMLTKPLPRERFRYPASLDDAKFVVLMDTDFHWNPSQDYLQGLLERVKKESWPVVRQSEHCTVLVNPRWMNNGLRQMRGYLESLDAP